MSELNWRALWAEARSRVGDPDARFLVEEASGFEGAELTVRLDDTPTRRAVARFDDMLSRRAGGEPLQYVLGHWAFRTLDLAVDRRALIPRPETEQVVEAALAELDRAGGRERPTTVVDLGTGSGAMGLAICVERPRTQVVLTDASPEAAELARANVSGLGRAGARVRVLEGSWYEALPDELAGEVDLVVSNPPYVRDDDALPPEVRDWEPHMALFAGHDGLAAVRVVLAGAPRWLRAGGAVVVELDPAQVAGAERLAREAGLVEVASGADLAGRPRWVSGRRRG